MTRAATQFGLLLVFLATGWGCSSNMRMPRLYNPGSAAVQRRSATQYADPYPLPDVGPEMVGARPREFQQPLPEVERSRLFLRSRQTPQFVAPAPQPLYPAQ